MLINKIPCSISFNIPNTFSLSEQISLINYTYSPSAEHYLPWAFTQCNIDCIRSPDDPWTYRDFITVDSDYYSMLPDHYKKEIEDQYSDSVEDWKFNNQIGG